MVKVKNTKVSSGADWVEVRVSTPESKDGEIVEMMMERRGTYTTIFHERVPVRQGEAFYIYKGLIIPGEFKVIIGTNENFFHFYITLEVIFKVKRSHQ